VCAVSGLNLHVHHGSVYGFLGPNGAGKTTTIRLLLGLVRPDRGDIHLLGQQLLPASRKQCLRRIGALVEAPSLYPHLTGRENLRVTQELLGLKRSNIDRALRVVDLVQDAERLVSSYSQGMRQRLGLALAMLAEPELLILDEPTNGLDPAGIHEIRELIRTLPEAHGMTVFLSSHLLAEVEQLASHVGIIGRGRLLFEGTLGELQRQRRPKAIIEVDQPSLARSVLSRAGWSVDDQGTPTLSLDVAERAEAARAASALVGAGLQLYQLQIVQPSLEDLFLELTRDVQLSSPGKTT
jgi:ABC-2 type transport system ATP-binding protein